MYILTFIFKNFNKKMFGFNLKCQKKKKSLGKAWSYLSKTRLNLTQSLQKDIKLYTKKDTGSPIFAKLLMAARDM